MVVNQAHLGCDKSVVLSSGSSRSGSRLPGFEELTGQIEGSLGKRLCHAVAVLFIHENHFLPWISMYLSVKWSMNFLTCIRRFGFQGLFWLKTRVLTHSFIGWPENILEVPPCMVYPRILFFIRLFWTLCSDCTCNLNCSHLSKTRQQHYVRR